MLETNLYSDFDINLRPHPVSGDILVRKDLDALKDSLMRILMVREGEIPFSDMGCGIYDMLFEPITTFTALSIQKTIEVAIENYEPRVMMKKIIVRPNMTEDGYDVSILFNMNDELSEYNYTFILERIK